MIFNRSAHPSPTRTRNACSPAHRIRLTIVPISAAIKDRRDPTLGCRLTAKLSSIGLLCDTSQRGGTNEPCLLCRDQMDRCLEIGREIRMRVQGTVVRSLPDRYTPTGG